MLKSFGSFGSTSFCDASHKSNQCLKYLHPISLEKTMHLASILDHRMLSTLQKLVTCQRLSSNWQQQFASARLPKSGHRGARRDAVTLRAQREKLGDFPWAQSISHSSTIEYRYPASRSCRDAVDLQEWRTIVTRQVPHCMLLLAATKTETRTPHLWQDRARRYTWYTLIYIPDMS